MLHTTVLTCRGRSKTQILHEYLIWIRDFCLLFEGTHSWMPLQISSGVFPTFLSVMARFLALLESSRDTLLGPFWITFCLLMLRSMDCPCAFVLNISSNSSTFRSWKKSPGKKNQFLLLFKTGTCERHLSEGKGSGISHLQDSLVVDVVKDSPVDLVWFEGNPVEDGHSEFCLDGFLDLYSWEEKPGD